MSLFHDAKQVLKKDRTLIKAQGCRIDFESEYVRLTRQNPISSLTPHYNTHAVRIDISANRTDIVIRFPDVLTSRRYHVTIPRVTVSERYLDHLTTLALDMLNYPCGYLRVMQWVPELPIMKEVQTTLDATFGPDRYDSMLVHADMLEEEGHSRIALPLRQLAEILHYPLVYSICKCKEVRTHHLYGSTNPWLNGLHNYQAKYCTHFGVHGRNLQDLLLLIAKYNDVLEEEERQKEIRRREEESYQHLNEYY